MHTTNSQYSSSNDEHYDFSSSSNGELVTASTRRSGGVEGQDK